MPSNIFSISIVFLFGLLLNSVQAAQLVSREEVLSEAKKVETYLTAYHPNLYAHRSRKELRRLWRKYKSELPEKLNYLDAASFHQKMLAAVCDEHTGVYLDSTEIARTLDRNKAFPFGLLIKGEKLLLDTFGYKRRGREVVRINDKSAEEIIDFLRSISADDGCQRSENLFSYHIGSPVFSSALLTNFVGNGSEFKMDLRNPQTDVTTTTTVPAISHFRTKQWETIAVTHRVSALKQLGINYYENRRRASYGSREQISVTTNADKSIYYVYISSFNGGEAQDKAIDRLMKQLVQAKPEHVFIDLTANPGGWILTSQRLLSYFLKTSSRYGTSVRSRVTRKLSYPDYTWSPDTDQKKFAKEIREMRHGRRKHGQYSLRLRGRTFGNRSYNGPLTVLVSPKTKSAATFVATTLKRKNGARIVGNIGSVSMKTSCAGSPGYHEMQHTKVRVAIPVYCYDRDPGSRTKGNVADADVPVDLTTIRFKDTNFEILKQAVRTSNLNYQVKTSARSSTSSHGTQDDVNELRMELTDGEVKKHHRPTRQGRKMHRCDILAAHGLDDKRLVSVGVSFNQLALRHKRAIHACENAIEKYPENTQIIYQMARAYHAGGKTAGKVQWLKKAVVLYKKAASMGHPLSSHNLGDLIQTFKSQGVYDVDDIGMVIRGKFMAKPGKQWVIRKDVYSRVQKKLEENGIEFARREVRVQMPDVRNSNEITDVQKSAIGAAAAHAQSK